MRSVRIAVAVVVGITAAVAIVGCSTTSRFHAAEMGPLMKPDMGAALANMDAAMADMDGSMKKGMAAHAQTLKLGERLFNEPALGRKALSCNSCHPGGGTTGGEVQIARKMGYGPYTLPIPSLAGAAARFPKYKVPQDGVISLAEINNNCIRMFMSGKRLPLNSPESMALAAFVSTFSHGEAVDVVDVTR
jgi:cytochrome c